MKHLRVSTPGRVCLFGEHQDYLGLPVIPCAISLRIEIEGSPTSQCSVDLDLPDIQAREFFKLEGSLSYGVERDYFRSAVNVMRRHGYTFSRGFRGTVRGRIPINAGTSSSSALVVTWIHLLARLSDQAEALQPELCARYAHEAEVLEFGEPGGMMDQYSTAMGGILAIDFTPAVALERLDPALGTFVLGDSGEPKDTRGILSRVKTGVLAIARQLRESDSGFSLFAARTEHLGKYHNRLGSVERNLLAGTVRNHEITLASRSLLRSAVTDHQRVGELLTEHQAILRDVLGISTPKIDRMLEVALAAGALGGKINGSGGGGCMFAYSPENPEYVAEAITRVGGRAVIVRSDRGTLCEMEM